MLHNQFTLVLYLSLAAAVSASGAGTAAASSASGAGTAAASLASGAGTAAASLWDALNFYEPSLLTATDSYKTAVVAPWSLNDGLWAAANSTRAEAPFIFAPHAAGMETVVNTSAIGECPASVVNVTTFSLPTASTGSAAFLSIAHGLSFAECVSHCCTSVGCAAAAWYVLQSGELLCQTYALGYSLGPQPFPSGDVVFAQGFELRTAPSPVDVIANGLRSGTFLGGIGNGGYELRADGTFHLEALRGQSPASEPWQGTTRDMALAVAVDGHAYAVRLRPFEGLDPVPSIVYAAAFPVAKLSFLNVALYAASALTPGDSNASNTPGVVYSLRVTNDGGTPLDASFALVRGLALRSDWSQVPAARGKAVPGVANATDCAAACVRANGAGSALGTSLCYSWQWAALEGGGACTIDSDGHALGSNAASTDSGTPGFFSLSEDRTSVTFVTSPPPASLGFNGLGGERLFTPPAATDSGELEYGVGAGPSISALLATLTTSSPSFALRGFAPPGADALFAMAVVSVHGLAPADSAVLSIVHAWHYPHFWWYRDAFHGRDNGVRYAVQHPDVASVAASPALAPATIARNLVAWQGIYAGLPALVRDAMANTLNHVRSSMWFAGDGEYRQWESLEFVDFGNPTNGDERHLGYFHAVPDAMRSQLLTWTRHAQNADGSFYCIILSKPNDQQYGDGDPCAGAAPHPDDVTMILVSSAEHLMLANDTALIAGIYPSLKRAFALYSRFNASAWHLPYQVHETYDAVPESETVTGEGNLGTSLFNAVQYLNGAHAMRELARSQGDASSEADADALIATASSAIQRCMWQPGLNSYVGDTLAGNAFAVNTAPNGLPFHSADGLHGQVLAYRLGFGDLLPRVQMQLHQRYILGDLATPWGLTWSTYAQQSWLMADHADTSLQLRWNEAGAWDSTLLQLRYFRDTKKDASRHTATVNTRNGQYALLNHYGYALFAHHALSAWTGQVAHLLNRTLAFLPHASAFDAAGGAVLPILLGGTMGSVTLSPTSAALMLAFAPPGAPPLDFLSIAICQHTFTATPAAPLVLSVAALPLILALPSPCNRSLAPASTVVSGTYCTTPPPVVVDNNEFAWSQDPLPPPLPGNTSLADCQSHAVAHAFCGYAFVGDASGGACTPVPGSAGAREGEGSCYIENATSPAAAATSPTAAAAAGQGRITLGYVVCDYSRVFTPPQIVNTSDVSLWANVTFAAPFEPLDSPAFSFPQPTQDACARIAATRQVCGWLYTLSLGVAPVGSCVHGGVCCVLSPYRGCASGAALGPSWGASMLGIFGGGGVLG